MIISIIRPWFWCMTNSHYLNVLIVLYNTLTVWKSILFRYFWNIVNLLHNFRIIRSIFLVRNGTLQCLLHVTQLVRDKETFFARKQLHLLFNLYFLLSQWPYVLFHCWFNWCSFTHNNYSFLCSSVLLIFQYSYSVFVL